MERSQVLAVTTPFLMVCSLYGGGGSPGSPGTEVPSAARVAAAAPATPGDYEGCGPGALPETGLQGQVPRRDQESGRSKLGYRCNLRPVGHSNIAARGANMQLAWYRDCAYVGIIGVREYFPQAENPELEGIAVIDAANPRRPQLVQIMRSPVGRNHHEGLEVHERRGMLVAQIGGISARYIEIYDVKTDCRRPRLKARYDGGTRIFHGLKISDDGNTIYATDGIGQGTPRQPLHVIDVSDMSSPRLLKTWGPLDAAGQPHLIHDLDLSHDGTRAYVGASPASTATLPGLGLGQVNDAVVGPTVVTLDTTAIRDRQPDPQLRVVSQVDLPNFGHTVQRARIGGRPYLVASGESPYASDLNCPWAWGHLIDMADERRPRVVSQLKLAVNEARNCAQANRDDVTYSIHYAGVDDERHTTKVFYTYYGGGLRVFDVRDPAHPKEIAYYHPPAQPRTVLQPLIGTLGGDAQTPAWDSAVSVVRYRPERGDIWFASIGGGLQIVELTGRYACLPGAAGVRGLRLGDAALRRSRAHQRAVLPARPQPPAVRHVDRYCTTDARELRIVYQGRTPPARSSPSHPRAALIVSTSAFASARGIRPGAGVRHLRRSVRGTLRVRAGGSAWYVTRRGRSRLVFETRRSRVTAVGVADPRAAGTATAIRRLLTRLG